MSEYDEPFRLGSALSELIAIRGYARIEENRRYHLAWKAVADAAWLPHTKVSRVVRGRMEIDVNNGPLLSELSSFHARDLLARLQAEHAELKIKDLKFRLRGMG